MELNDAEDLRDVLRDRVDVVLFGHKHRSHLRKGFCGVPIWAGAPSSVGLDGQGFYKFRAFEIDERGSVDSSWVKFKEEEIGAVAPVEATLECPVKRKDFSASSTGVALMIPWSAHTVGSRWSLS